MSKPKTEVPCGVCARTWVGRRFDWRTGGVLSPTGRIHIALAERTLCDKDATADGWLWEADPE